MTRITGSWRKRYWGININLARERVDLIYASVRRLEKLAELSPAEFAADLDHFAIAEHHLQRALEAIFDVGRHIIAKEGWGACTLEQLCLLPHFNTDPLACRFNNCLSAT